MACLCVSYEGGHGFLGGGVRTNALGARFFALASALAGDGGGGCELVHRVLEPGVVVGAVRSLDLERRPQRVQLRGDAGGRDRRDILPAEVEGLCVHASSVTDRARTEAGAESLR
jgi:hypothetical protein